MVTFCRNTSIFVLKLLPDPVLAPQYLHIYKRQSPHPISGGEPGAGGGEGLALPI